MIDEHPLSFFILFMHICHGVGICLAIHALLHVRTSQATVAWVVSLASIPLLAIPLYLIFGRNKFQGYVELIRAQGLEKVFNTEKILAGIKKYSVPELTKDLDFMVFEKLAKMGFTKGNKVDLLIDGEETFDAIIDEIKKAENYILFQFFIVRDDELGRKIKDALIKKAAEGVSVYFLYDEIGSKSLPKKYIQDLQSRKHIEIHPFQTTKGWTNRFQINFRNHRKIVVVDGHTAFVGGHNVGIEYLGRNPKVGHWRDTHCKIQGPAVKEVQLVFLDDWHWATNTVPELNWEARLADSHTSVMALPTGPADKLDSGILYFNHIINIAKKRIWIASPYFVPDASIIDALQLAALQGIDVRIIIPQNPDSYLPYLAAYSYIPEVEESGIKIYRYKNGFIHQKVILIDDEFCSIGTANMDNRSMRLNFEVSMLIHDRRFAAEVERMLDNDIAGSRLCSIDDYIKKGFWFRVAVQFFRLFSPIL